jgi:hypothetical protein
MLLRQSGYSRYYDNPEEAIKKVGNPKRLPATH